MKYIFSAPNELQGKNCFLTAKGKLLNINRWGELCGTNSPAFRLMNSRGKAVTRLPEEGDLIRIEPPGKAAPDETREKKYRWLRIERLEESSVLTQAKEEFTLRISEMPCPESPTLENAGSGTPEAFTIRRRGKKVSVLFSGNISIADINNSKGIVRRARNIIASLISRAAPSTVKWRAFTRGLLEK